MTSVPENLEKGGGRGVGDIAGHHESGRENVMWNLHHFHSIILQIRFQLSKSYNSIMVDWNKIVLGKFVDVLDVHF